MTPLPVESYFLKEKNRSKPRLMLQGDHAGCVEGRPGFHKSCEFDGRFSLIHFRNRFILFARANMPVVQAGVEGLPPSYARAIQMTHSSDLNSWSPFQLIKMKDVDL